MAINFRLPEERGAPRYYTLFKREAHASLALFMSGQASETTPPSCILSSRNGQLMLHGEVVVGFDGLHPWLMA